VLRGFIANHLQETDNREWTRKATLVEKSFLSDHPCGSNRGSNWTTSGATADCVRHEGTHWRRRQQNILFPICITLSMPENIDSVSSPPVDSRQWVAKVILAVILAEAIWGLILSLTHGLVLPVLARFMSGDPQSPVYLGKGDFDVRAIFSSILELCFAVIAAAVLSYWSRPRPARGHVKAVKTAPAQAKPSTIASKGVPSILSAPSTPTPVSVPTAPAAPQPVATTEPSVPSISPTSVPKPAVEQTVASSKPAAPARPQKLKKPKDAYYNIVGERIYPTEDDD
jgi:hypothetical protein